MKGGSGEATLGGVDRGEECGRGTWDAVLKDGAEVSIFNLISFDRDWTRASCLLLVLAPGEAQTAGLLPQSCPNDSSEGWESRWEK